MKTEAARPLVAGRERVGQVISNLLSNVVKYSPRGTVISIASQPERDGVKVSVEDKGYGIPDAEIDKIFERFFRVTANNMDTFPGMGLGLYITTQIIQKHGGTISVQSREGEGSVFSFWLSYNNHS